MSNKSDILTLKKAILDLHQCDSEWIESVPIKEMFGETIVWDGIVQVFKLVGHLTAGKCYAWSHEIEGSAKRKFYAVLHQGPVDSPENAVRAAIVQNYKEGEK